MTYCEERSLPSGEHYAGDSASHSDESLDATKPPKFLMVDRKDISPVFSTLSNRPLPKYVSRFDPDSFRAMTQAKSQAIQINRRLDVSLPLQICSFLEYASG